MEVSAEVHVHRKVGTEWNETSLTAGNKRKPFYKTCGEIPPINMFDAATFYLGLLLVSAESRRFSAIRFKSLTALGNCSSEC